MDLYLKLNYLIINVLGAKNQIFSLTVILPKVFFQVCCVTVKNNEFRRFSKSVFLKVRVIIFIFLI